MTINSTILFHEEQQFKRPWLFVLSVVAMLIPIGILVSEIMKKKLNIQELVLSLIAVTVIEIPIFAYLYLSKLETIVTAEGLGFRWWPLQRKYRMLFKENIMDIKTRKSPAMTYGYHWLPGFGWVNNVRGRMGVQIKMKSGKRLYIGSVKIDELKTALEKLLNTRIVEFRDEF